MPLKSTFRHKLHSSDGRFAKKKETGESDAPGWREIAREIGQSTRDATS